MYFLIPLYIGIEAADNPNYDYDYDYDPNRERAIGEVRAAAQLPTHPHCLKYYQAWIENGYLFIQTELCDGSLREFLDKMNADNKEIREGLIWSFLLDMALVSDMVMLHLILILIVVVGIVITVDLLLEDKRSIHIYRYRYRYR